jgi:two-component system sensor histidine kinase/response regulator
MMSDTRPARLLVVDDEAALMRSLCETLRDRGYEVTGFTSARAALVALREGAFDLLLADLAMAEMDGITLLREALQIDSLLVGVIMTGEGTIGSAVEAMRSGAYDYVLKPFKMGAILPVLQRGLAMRALRAENAELEGRLRERAAELEVANRELDAFTRSASHDLRAPLANVASISTLLTASFASQVPAQVLRWLREIDAESRRMMQLLDDLMRLSRLGRQPLDLQTVDVTSLVQDVVGELRQRESDRSIQVLVDPLPAASADVALLRQVFVNLLSNAFKFTRGREQASVHVGCETQDEGATYFVSDNGAGFDMANAAKLFEAFQRLHPQSRFEGSGVGLSIVHSIVQRHGGQISVQAAPERGALFRFTLTAPKQGHLSLGAGRSIEVRSDLSE